MSGGHFNYDQYRIRTIAETIRSIIDNNTKKDQWGYAGNYNEETLKYFERAIEILKIAEVYTQRIDWLVSGDDGEETFMKRLHKELAEIKAIPIEPPVMQKIAVVIEDLFKLYEQGDFSNGVECCGMDQGYIHARDYINNLRIDWNKIKAESNFSV